MGNGSSVGPALQTTRASSNGKNASKSVAEPPFVGYKLNSFSAEQTSEFLEKKARIINIKRKLGGRGPSAYHIRKPIDDKTGYLITPMFRRYRNVSRKPPYNRNGRLTREENGIAVLLVRCDEGRRGNRRRKSWRDLVKTKEPW
jgi:hypothetical protein